MSVPALGCIHCPSKASLPVPAVGGVMGYKKKGSRDSLIASSILAGLLVLSAGLMSLAGNSYGVRLAAGQMCTVTSYWFSSAQKCSCP